MKIKFLGTGGADGVPATFCNCENCQTAIKLGGKNIRTRTQILIDDDFMIDFPQDGYYHKLKYNLDLRKVKHLFFTHSHADHSYLFDLFLRTDAFASGIDELPLDIYCNKKIIDGYDLLSKYENANLELLSKSSFLHEIAPFQKLQAGDYTVYTLKAKHAFQEDAMLFLIGKGGKWYLHGTDSGYFYEENFEFIKNLQIKIDLVSLNCAFSYKSFGNDAPHMGHKECLKVIEKLKEIKAVKDGTRYILTHFSHLHNPLQEYNEEKMRPFGVEIAYDGLEVEI